MKKLLKLLLLPALCAFVLLQAQQVTAQSKDNDVLVMEYVNLNTAQSKSNGYGLYLFWPDKDIEFVSVGGVGIVIKDEEILAIKVKVYKKINELADMGWDLYLVDNSLNSQALPGFGGIHGSITYYFKRATAK